MDKWRKSFEHQTGKVCTGISKSKEAKCGELRMGSQLVQYTVGWRQNYVCFRGG